MNNSLYKMIFKRKSFHLFSGCITSNISSEELSVIEEFFNSVTPLVNGIKVKMKIVKDNTRGCEYSIRIYSEVKDNYLNNVGYIVEQLDLFLVSMDIGSLWYGIGKVSEPKVDDLEFVIMILIGKVSSDKFRKDMYKSKRKELSEIWDGTDYLDIANVVRYAPSACNTQPWFVKSSNNTLLIYRYKNPLKRGIMPINMVNYYNQIDIGIFLCFMDLCLNNKGICYEKMVYVDSESDKEYTLCARYEIK